MPSTLFILGRTPDMAFLELKTFFPDIRRVATNVAQSDTPLVSDPNRVLEVLGGTVKVAELLDRGSSITAESIASHIDTSRGKTVFGVSVYGEVRTVKRQLLEEAKRLLEGRGSSVRFVEARGAELSSVVIQKGNVQEILFVKTPDSYVIARTIAVQPFETWSDRDFGRPNADPKAGMLPVKVSRMAVNIADGTRKITEKLSQKTLLDPFCGMGTILSEALVMGWNAVGGDQSTEVIEKARKNLRWLVAREPDLGVTFRLNTSDATHISQYVDEASVDAVVTEPFMGNISIRQQASAIKPDAVKNTVKGLEKLYIGCLKDWHTLLKPGGVVMIAFPQYQLNGKTYFVKKVIDMCENLGYTIQAGPIEYGRPQAIVRRHFYLFQKK